MHQIGYTCGGLDRIFVLPDANNRPAVLGERAIRLDVLSM